MNDNDQQIVQAIIRRDEAITRQVFYVKCYPLFKALYEKYYTDCDDCLEFINQVYLHIMMPRGEEGKSYLETFSHKCHFVYWLKIVAETYCHQLYKKRCDIYEESLDDGDRLPPAEVSVSETMNELNAMDISTLLQMMPNERYRKLIRLRYVEERSNEETAQLLNMSMDNFYNKHRLAKLQFLQVLRKEQNSTR